MIWSVGLEDGFMLPQETNSKGEVWKAYVGEMD